MNKLKIFLLLITVLFFFSGCKYSFIVPEEAPIIDTTTPTSFATKIAPIFEAKCIECHKSGGQSPYLSASVAYSQIVPNYVNTTTPESSKIYTYLLASTSGHSQRKYSSTEAALVLTWIKEGAKNN